MAMESKVMKITPEMAKAMLENNMENNRRLNHETVKRYARLMRCGGWGLTHQGIAFDDKGILVDGQHRLNAIVEANVPIEMMVTYGVEHKAGEVFAIDLGQKRTFHNLMQISGIHDEVYYQMGGIVRTYLRFKGTMKNQCTDHQQVISYIDRHIDEITELSKIIQVERRGTNRLQSIVGAAMLAAYYRGEKKDALEKFAMVYKYNELTGCENYNPKFAINLRDMVKKQKHIGELYTRCECYLYAFCNNRAVVHIRDNCYPYNAGLDA